MNIAKIKALKTEWTERSARAVSRAQRKARSVVESIRDSDHFLEQIHALKQQARNREAANDALVHSLRKRIEELETDKQLAAKNREAIKAAAAKLPFLRSVLSRCVSNLKASLPPTADRPLLVFSDSAEQAVRDVESAANRLVNTL